MKNRSKEYTVAMMSRVLDVSRSGYYKWLEKEGVTVKKTDELNSDIKTIFSVSKQTYGSPRITIELQKRNINYSKSTVARRMASLRIYARSPRKYVSTTDSEHDYKVADNLLDRKFSVKELNTAWVSDITYVRVKDSWMYLTTMIDLADRMVVGWSLSGDMTTKNTVCAAFKSAVVNRGIKKKSNLMLHSDRGVQYASKEFRTLIESYGCIQSMSRKGNCWDNAPAESFFKTIKVEALYKYKFLSKEHLKTVIFRYIDGWYNTIRIHSSLGGKSPLETYLDKARILTAA